MPPNVGNITFRDPPLNPNPKPVTNLTFRDPVLAFVARVAHATQLLPLVVNAHALSVAGLAPAHSVTILQCSKS